MYNNEGRQKVNKPTKILYIKKCNINTDGTKRFDAPNGIEINRSDADGTLLVTAESVTRLDNRSFRAHNIQVTATGEYSTWYYVYLEEEAAEMIVKTYFFTKQRKITD